MTDKFKKLEISHWRQFDKVSIQFSPRVTILTGRNGTGKTTVLNILAKHGTYSSNFIGSPQLRDALGRFTSGIWGPQLEEENSNHVIGKIEYENSPDAYISVPENVNVNFSPDINPKTNLSVLNIPSHRHIPNYRPVSSIPTRPITRESALGGYHQVMWADSQGRPTRESPLVKMKESLISMAAFGPGNARVEGNKESETAFMDFEKRLSQIIPKNIGFEKIIVKIPDVIISTKSGDFLIDASSGGLMSLIDITWQISLFGQQKEKFVVVIDEPENHLHPSMQREFLPAIVNAFPEAQFIIATHSPFIVSSVRDAIVYIFDINEAEGSRVSPLDATASFNTVFTERVNFADRQDADEILNRVLGVPVSIPIWVEDELDRILSKYRQSNFSESDIERIYEDLEQEGLGDFLPEIIRKKGYNKND